MATKAEIAKAKANAARRKRARAKKGSVASQGVSEPFSTSTGPVVGDPVVGMRPGEISGANPLSPSQVAQATVGVPRGGYSEAKGLQRTEQHAVQPQPGYPMAQVPGGGYGVALVPFQAPGDPSVRVARTYSAAIGDARKVYDAADWSVIRGSSEWDGYWGRISGFEDEILNFAGEGSEFTRVRNGWRVKFMDGGAVISGSGPTIIEAILSHGEQIDHDATATAARAADAARIQAAGDQRSADSALIARAASPQESIGAPSPAVPVDESGMTKAQVKASRAKAKKQAAVDAKAAKKQAVLSRGRQVVGYNTTSGGYVQGSAAQASV